MPAFDTGELAPLWKRLVAGVIDNAPFFLLTGTYGIIYVAHRATGTPLNFSTLPASQVPQIIPSLWLFAGISLVLFFGLYPLMIIANVILVKTKAASMGKLILGLRIVREEDISLVFRDVIIREIVGRFISTLGLGIGYLWILFDKRRQGWHDKMARTLVIRRRYVNPAARPAAPSGENIVG